MRLVKLECSKCKATLDVDMEKMMSFCPYCGSKLMIEVDNLSEILKEKERTKQTEIVFDSENRKTDANFSIMKFLILVWIFSIVIFAVLSLFTLDNVDFSPYQPILIIDLIVGAIVIVRYLKKNNK